MSSISVETENETQLTVAEYVRLVKIKEQVQQFLENANIKGMLCESEESINGLTIDLTIKYSVNKREN
ncbi:MAG: hypothetical protein FIB08_14455 [Candidatus Methanoperedens sp.]|nr:hypothetical protein [Candidatus Methanoperedens sp.]